MDMPQFIILALKIFLGKLFRESEQKKWFWREYQGKNIVISDMVAFYFFSVQELIPANQMNQRVHVIAELRFVVTYVGHFHIPISEHFRLKTIVREII
jgi:hypothetical protein